VLQSITWKQSAVIAEFAFPVIAEPQPACCAGFRFVLLSIMAAMARVIFAQISPANAAIHAAGSY